MSLTIEIEIIMNESENFFEKAFYVGIGLAGLAIEKANDNLQELRKQVESFSNSTQAEFSQRLQEVADEMVEKGRINAEEARRFVDDMMKQHSNSSNSSNSSTSQDYSNSDNNDNSPRKIEIVFDDDDD